MATEIVCKAIGFYQAHDPADHPYQVPRQSDDSARLGNVVLDSGQNFEQALQDLSGFERVWLIYQFHENKHWKPMVLPPRGTDSKKGVFSTRSPYRPNPIGLSCVKLVNINNLTLTVSGADLLSGTPILDIKPYLPEADSFPDSTVGWLSEVECAKFNVTWAETAKPYVEWLQSQGLSDLIEFAQRQLEFEPLDERRKRVAKTETGFALSYRTWRIDFQVYGSNIVINGIRSGYSTADLASQEDPHLDKALHRAFGPFFSLQQKGRGK